jgi:transcriptional regulator with XRE-family HTH domain
MAGIDVRHLGDYIRDQRRDSNVSLRQLAKLAGVSNPYLSQIERGLRKPSAEILQQIAKALRISAEALYVQAGILEQREGSGLVADAVLGDDGLNERQKQVLLEIYDSFRKENAAKQADAPVDAEPGTEAQAGATEPLAPVVVVESPESPAPENGTPPAGRTPARPPRTTARKATTATTPRKSVSPTAAKRTSKRIAGTGTTPTPNDTAPGGTA